MTQFNSKGTVQLKEDPDLFEGVLVMTGTRSEVVDGRFTEYSESRTRTAHIGQVRQLHIEEFYQDLSTRWPELENFQAFMSPATLKEYGSCAYGKERIILTPDSTESI